MEYKFKDGFYSISFKEVNVDRTVYIKNDLIDFGDGSWRPYKEEEITTPQLIPPNRIYLGNTPYKTKTAVIYKNIIYAFREFGTQTETAIISRIRPFLNPDRLVDYYLINFTNIPLDQIKLYQPPTQYTHRVFA